MTYDEIKKRAQSGDVLMVEGRGWASRFIRMVTGQNISHVAMLIWLGNQLWVCEMKEFHGYRLMPASLWTDDTMRTGALVYWGKAPQVVRHSTGNTVHDAAFSYRNKRYSYRALFKVWWAQFVRKKTGADLVCSTFVQRCWEVAGYQFDQTADPGDYMHLCEAVRNIDWELNNA